MSPWVLLFPLESRSGLWLYLGIGDVTKFATLSLRVRGDAQVVVPPQGPHCNLQWDDKSPIATL